jgi:putative acetyltransferase
MIIGAGDLDDPRVIALLTTHHERALAVTPRENAHVLDVSALRAPHIRFVAAYEGNTLLGVAALAELDPDHAEIKSMHTAEAVRGRGVGTALVRHLIDLARSSGYRALSLETGTMDYFAPARALYRRQGFVDCEAFGGYAPSPHNQFMRLELNPDSADVAPQ